jgi:hypothetical protein
MRVRDGHCDPDHAEHLDVVEAIADEAHLLRFDGVLATDLPQRVGLVAHAEPTTVEPERCDALARARGLIARHRHHRHASLQA